MYASGQPRSPVGGALLISGSCIGAGMLAFPITSGIAGFFPALFSFVLAWVFMTTAAFLLLEVNLRFGVDVSLVTMAERTFGPLAKTVVWITFLFLFYALNVAYITGSAKIVQGLFEQVSGKVFSANLIASLLSLFVVWAILFGYRYVIGANRWLMGVLILSYITLVVFCSPMIHVENLMHTNWGFAIFTLPVMMVSFGFQNLIPSLTDIYGGNPRSMRRVLWGGGFLTLVIYLIWQCVVLGVVPLNGPYGIIDNIAHGREAGTALTAITKQPLIGLFTWAFALSAILTSFLAQSLSLLDFIADGLGMDKDVRFERLILSLLAVGPPFIISLINPNLFLQALSFAGGICAMILFGIMPALMCYKGRYHRNKKNPQTHFRVPGGRGLLVAVIVISFAVIAIELCREIMGISV